MAGRYELAPATRMLWRSNEIVQFELGERSVLVEGLAPQAARSLTSHRVDEPPAGSADALARLAALGLVWPREPEESRTPPSPRLATELAALSARRGPDAATALDARRHACVAVHGVGRAGPLVGAILAASGVGNVHFLATTDAKAQHALPGGVTPGDEFQRLAVAARAAVRRAAPSADVHAPRSGLTPDLVLLAVDEPVGDDRREALHLHGRAHLRIALSPTEAVVGPLVLPGLTSCLHCADLYRAERDTAWPRLAVQLTVARRHTYASETSVATIAAGLAAAQVLAFLDGEESACLDGTLELQPPDWRIRRRSRPVHPKCDCCGP